MILYHLTNTSFVMDVFEDKITLKPRLWLRVLHPHFRNDITLPYEQIKQVNVRSRLWPMRHLFQITTEARTYQFGFYGTSAFYDRLTLYTQRQMLKYSAGNKPGPFIKGVLDLVEERKKRKAATAQNQLAA